MELKELKESILDNTLSDDFIIFVCPENTFIAEQYINEICNNKLCAVNRINSIFEPTQSALSLVIDYTLDLNVLYVDKFSEYAEDYSSIKNVIVVCKEIDKKIKNLVAPYAVIFNPLLDWQVLDYMRVICPGLMERSSENVADSDYDYLYDVLNKDIYRITNELDKLSYVDISKRHDIIEQMKSEKDSNNINMKIFDLANAIMRNDADRIVLSNYLLNQKSVDFDQIALTNILLNNYKELLFSFGDKYRTYKDPIADLNMDAFKVRGIRSEIKKYGDKDYTKYNRHYFLPSEDNIRKIISFLSSIDIKLKNNLLDMSRETFISYIICNIYQYLY